MTDKQETASERAATGGTRCGFVAVIGAPNAGKSTLVNRMVGGKVTIVSRKVQTTRTPLRGICVHGKSQLVFIDTPGIFEPKRRLDRAMVDAAVGGAASADYVVFLVDAAAGLGEDISKIKTKISKISNPLLIVLNKIDRVKDKQKLLEFAQDLSSDGRAEHVFMISAETGSGVEDLKNYLAEHAPLGPWHFPEDDMSDAPLRVLAAEITREKIYHFLHQELPYATTVETASWKDLKDGSVRIEQTIFVERAGQKSIVLGKGGQTIKKISSAARTELTELFDRNVHLFVYVKVRENWGSDPERYREMGLEFPKTE
ncbi:MAG: GTPase Era [Alphaproteobacteria bacterium]|nr:GTPase Era [Alphaproteobacteria bacterium]